MDENELNELFGITEDDSQDGAVDHEDDVNATDEGADEGEGTIERKEDKAEDSADDVANHQQTQEENRGFANARKQAEAELRTEREKYSNMAKDQEILLEALKNFGYEGTPQEIADTLMAKRTGDTAENIAKQREAKNAEIQEAIKNAPEVLQAQALIKEQANRMAQQDLANISKVNPEIKSMQDLFEKTPEEDMNAINALVASGWRIDKAYMKIVGVPKKGPEKADNRAHIKRVNGASNEEAFQVNQDEYEFAKDLMPNLTKTEYEEFCRKQR